MIPFAATNNPAICSLDSEGLSGRLAGILLLAERHLQSERQVGRTLRLNYAKEAHAELRRILELERQCCPLLVFDLKEDGGGIQLSITAPSNSDAFTSSLYDHFRGVAVSAPAQSCAGSGCGCTA